MVKKSPKKSHVSKEKKKILKNPKYKLTGSNKTVQFKIKMLEALGETFGHIGRACDKAGIHRRSHNRWANKDPEYERAVYELGQIVIDDAELMLMSQVNKGDTRAIIFLLNTKGKDRGWVEKQEVAHTTEDPLKIEVNIPDDIKKLFDKQV